MHTWLWGQIHPTLMDALMPLAAVPAQIAGRNRAWRRVLIDAIRTDLHPLSWGARTAFGV